MNPRFLFETPTRAETPGLEDALAALKKNSQGFRIDVQERPTIIAARDTDSFVANEWWSKETQQQFEQETREDIEAFVHRLERLKIGLLKLILTYGGFFKTEEEKAWESRIVNQVFNYAERVQDTAQGGTVGFDTEAYARALLHLVNRMIPKEFDLKLVHGQSWQEVANLCLFFCDLLRENIPTDADQRERIERALTSVQRLEEESLELLVQRELFPVDLHENNKKEKRMDVSWKKYRRLLKEYALFLEEDSWRSPAYGASRNRQKGPNQFSRPFANDYQRWTYDELTWLESKLQEEYAEFPAKTLEQESGSYLFGSGMAALQAIFVRLEQLHKRGEQRKIGKRSAYFETDLAIDEFCGRNGTFVEDFDDLPSGLAASWVKDKRPLAFFTAPLVNDSQFKPFDVKYFLEQLKGDKWPAGTDPDVKTYIVIDNTTLGRLAAWKEGFDPEAFPSWICIVSYESLLKYAQDGQELTQGALLSIFGTKEDVERIGGIRKKLGLTPDEPLVRRLKTVMNTEVIDENLERHSRNTNELARLVERDIKSHPDSFVKQFHKPSTDYAGIQLAKNTGGLASIQFDFRFLETYQERIWDAKVPPIVHLPRMMSVDDPKESPTKPEEWSWKTQLLVEGYENLVLLLARAEGVDLNEGTSYGFHTTRIARYHRKRKSHDPYLPPTMTDNVCYMRISTGTENIRDTILFASILCRANHLFMQARDAGYLNALCHAVNVEIDEGDETIRLTFEAKE